MASPHGNLAADVCRRMGSDFPVIPANPGVSVRKRRDVVGGIQIHFLVGIYPPGIRALYRRTVRRAVPVFPDQGLADYTSDMAPCRPVLPGRIAGCDRLVDGQKRVGGPD